MKEKFFGSITSKLLLINVIILGIFGGIILVVHSSFSNVETSLKTIIDRDINRVTKNARVGRELTRVFADMKQVVDDYAGSEEILKEKAETLIQRVNTLATENTDAQLQETLHVFAQKLLFLFEQSAELNKVLQEAHTLDREFATTLAALEETISENLILEVLDGAVSTGLEQLSALISGYRETTLWLAVEFTKVQQEHSSEGNPEEQYPVLFSLLDDLTMRFRTLTSADPEVAEYGQQLIDMAEKYRGTITLFHEALTQFKSQLGEVDAIQNQVLIRMNKIDEDVAQATVNIQADITNVIGASIRNILLLSLVFLGVLVFAWLRTRSMTKPLEHLSHYAEQMAYGDIEEHVLDIRTHDEIGRLSRAFRKLITYFREMAYDVTEISQGNLELEIGVRSKKDVLGNGFRQMIIYLKEMGNFADHVARGDLRSHIALRSEADQLGNAFLRMKEGLISLIAEIRSGADHIASISNQVLNTSQKNSEALEHIGNAAEVTSSAMQQVSASAEEVRVNTEHLTSSVEETSSSISEMITSIKHVAENSRKLSGFADKTTGTMAAIVQSLEKVANQAEHSKTLAETTAQDAVSGQVSVEQMITRVTGISTITQNISDIISRLEERSTEIGTILDVINEVADQTSLLALNASIIAAQAGAHGRGFAVVADEIKELATRVGTSTQEISQIIKSVQHDSLEAVNAIEQGQQEVKTGVADALEAGEALKKIGQSAKNSSQVAAEIAVSVGQQATASTNVADSIRDVTNMINEISQATQEQEKNSIQLFNVVEQMQAMAAQVMRATQEQQKSTLHVTEFMESVIQLVSENAPTVTQLARSANKLASQADALKEQVERFILPVHEERT